VVENNTLQLLCIYLKKNRRQWLKDKTNSFSITQS